jgi:hypothetical protein
MRNAVGGNFLLLEHVMTFSVVTRTVAARGPQGRGYITAKMAALPANSRAESGLKPCFRFRPWNGFLWVPFHIFQTLFKQSFLGLSQRIVLIKPLIGIELSELETNLLPLFLSELGQFLQNLGFAHRWNLTGQLGVVRMKIGSRILH